MTVLHSVGNLQEAKRESQAEGHIKNILILRKKEMSLDGKV